MKKYKQDKAKEKEDSRILILQKKILGEGRENELSREEREYLCI
jgi:hypothetical protein